MGEGQFRVADGALSQLNEIDNAATAALDAGDEATFRAQLGELHAAVRAGGTPLDAADLSPSDLIVPPVDLSLDEGRELFSGDGQIRDQAVAG